jgi:T-complex protein 1 subunit beta
MAISDLVKTTLGPRGLDKILQKIGENDQSVSVTNDGATILRSVYVDNPAAKVLIDISKTQDEQVGDGTTSVAVLAGELLRQAEQLVNQRIHPQTICTGWRLARDAARKALTDMAMDLARSCDDEQADVARRQETLEIAQTTLSSKLLTHDKAHFAKLAVDAVLRAHGILDHIVVLKKLGGSMRESYLEEGFLLDGKSAGTGQPTQILEGGARILLANTSMDTDKIKIYGSRVKVDSINKVAEIEQAEKAKMKTKVQKIVAHKTADGKPMNCFINRQLIYNYPESLFAEAGVMSIEHADFDGIERLAAVLGGHVVSTFDNPEQTVLGECKSIREILIGEDKVIQFAGCKAGNACSIVLRGSSSHLLDEAERSLHDALAILASTLEAPQTVYGGGCTEIAMAAAVDQAAANTPGKASIAMEAFARALRELPTAVADNAGCDAAELIAHLRAAHASGNNTYGLDVTSTAKGSIVDMKTAGIRESYKSKLQMLLSASEAAEMILRVDDIVKAAPRRRDQMGY